MVSQGGPRYSVLLPTHNRADVLGFAIQSVLAQSDPDFELLVVGDGCTDATAQVVAAFGDERVRWFDLPKAPGFGYANRNVALREARGRLMAFMAHDDLMLPDHLALLAAPFADTRVSWAYSRPLWVSDEGAIVPFPLDLRQPNQLEDFLTRRNSLPASCVVYRRSLHEGVGMWPEDAAGGADWELWKRMLRSGPGDSGAVDHLGHVRAPTILHFRANWRDVAAWGPPPLAALLKAGKEPWWPAGLRIPIDQKDPQATLASLLSPAWTADLRSAVDDAIDALAWRKAADLHRGRRRSPIRWLRHQLRR